MKPLYKKSKNESANITLLAMLMLLVLSLVGATVLLNATTRYNGSMNTGGWQEALPAAEAGSEFGLTNCRWTTWTAGGVNHGFDTTNGWSLVDPTNAQGQNKTFSSPLGYSYTLPAQYTIGPFTQTGQGALQTTAKVVVDAPSSMIDSQGNQWFRIRSTGYANLPAHDRISIDTRSDRTAKAADTLRKFSFNIDRFTGAALNGTPQATRRIEVVAQPVPSFGAAIIANSALKAVNAAYMVDSYDSRDPNKSTNGMYDPAKAQWHGDIYANFTAPNAIPNLSGDIYGNVYTESSSVNLTGTIHGTTTYNAADNYTPPVLVPNWTNISSNPSGAGAYQAGTVASPTYYVTSGAGNVTINPPAGGVAGSINIYFTDDFAGSVTVPVGVTTRIWLGGHMKTPNINNLNNNAAYLQFFGISSVPNQKIETKDTTGYYAMIYAPNAQIKTGAGDIYGSIIGDNVNIKNSIHYDQAFNALGIAVDYTRASWVEDPR